MKICKYNIFLKNYPLLPTGGREYELTTVTVCDSLIPTRLPLFLKKIKRCTSRSSKFTYIFLEDKNYATILTGIISKGAVNFVLKFF
jgi:hypothetical protein